MRLKPQRGDKKLPIIKNYRTAKTTKCVIQYKFVSKLPDRQEFNRVTAFDDNLMYN